MLILLSKKKKGSRVTILNLETIAGKRSQGNSRGTVQERPHAGTKSVRRRWVKTDRDNPHRKSKRRRTWTDAGEMDTKNRDKSRYNRIRRKYEKKRNQN